jgi:hypothetical protein
MSCGKRRYETRQEAKNAKRLLNLKKCDGQVKLTSVYFCTNCLGYHMTSQPKSVRAIHRLKKLNSLQL